MSWLKKEDLPRGKAVSFSRFKHFIKSPKHYIHALEKPFIPTDAMRLGSLVDCLLLTPDEFESRYLIIPDIDKRTKAGKELFQTYLTTARVEEKEMIEEWMKKKADLMIKEVRKNWVAMEILNETTETQKRYDWIHRGSGVPCSGISDGRGDNFIFDLKTTSDASKDAFHRSIIYDHYYLQAAMYINAEGTLLDKWPENFYWIAVESVEPYGVSVHRADKDIIEYGKQQLDLYLKKFAACVKNNKWEADYEYHAMLGKFTTSLPGWLKNSLNE